MDKQKKLMWQMMIFFLFIFVAFGLIVLDELGNPILARNIENKINDYIEENYSDNYIIGELTYMKDGRRFEKRLEHKDNTNLFFTVTYKNRKITDDYKKSFVEGKSLFTYYEDKYTKELNHNSNYPFKLKFIIPKKFNEFNDSTQEKIIKSKTIKDLSIYGIKSIGEIDNFEIETFVTTLLELDQHLVKQGEFTPVYYDIDFTNKDNNLENMKVNNINRIHLNKDSLTDIFERILSGDKELEKEFDITCEYNK